MTMSVNRRENICLKLWRSFLFCIALMLATGAWARGGGGCLEEGTLIATPGGEVVIEKLRPGDAVCSVVDGKLQRATVQAVSRVEPGEYCEISAAGKTLRATVEHPLQIGPGIFRAAAGLQPGDPLCLLEGGDFQTRLIASVTRIPAIRPAYNLLVLPGGTYIANGIVVHNKGCFVPDTPVLRADGTESPISEIRPGDELLAFTTRGEIVRTKVRNIITHDVDEYLVVATPETTLRVTREHPFYVGNGTFKTLESLKVGDEIFSLLGGKLQPQRIISLKTVQAPTRVYNLQTDQPNTYFASGVAVHNKGGCFPAGTRVSTPRGEIPIEALEPGETVFAVDAEGNRVETAIEAVHQTRSALLVFETDKGTLQTTKEHPLLSGSGDFRLAAEFKRGDQLVTWKNSRQQPTTIRQITATTQEVVVYNLQVGEPHTFIADGFVVHNKGGGCFPAGTRVSTPRGEIPIEALEPGETVFAVDAEENRVETAIEAVHQTRSALLVFETDKGTLQTTKEHPLLSSSGDFRLAAEFKRGDQLVTWKNSRQQPATIRQITATTQEVVVYNLQVGEPHTFIADGFVVHNKGGGFHGGGSRGGGSDDPTAGFIFSGIFIAVVIFCAIAARSRGGDDEDLDFVYSRSVIQPKAAKTKKLLEFLARVDQTMDPEKLADQAKSTFVKLQSCWQAREYQPMQPLLMPDLFAEHCAQLDGLIANHEVNMISNLRVEQMDIVNVRYTHKEDEREFTALITASARDFYVDDRTREFLRGDDEPARFQEFWTFQRQEGTWLLREIEQSRESDALKEENFFEQFTDTGLNQVYDDTAGRSGPAGPWLDDQTLDKANKTERLLNFLVQTDKLWNRQAMLERARKVFLDVTLAREKGDPGAVPADEMFPDIAAGLQAELVQLGTKGTKLEFRNLCVRKVELILVQNYDDNSQDEFTVRISAHAQRAVLRNNLLISRDAYVTPFVEFWTFGRLDNEWKLKEVVLADRGGEKVSSENVDEDSSPSQLQWYYKQTRAV